MIIYDIPKENRKSFKLELDKKFCFIYAPVYYLSVRRKSDNSEVDFFCFATPVRVNIQKMIEHYADSSIDIVCVYDSSKYIDVDYSMYDAQKFKSFDFFNEVVF